MKSALWLLVLASTWWTAAPMAHAALPTLVFSISQTGQTICDSDCTTCTVASGECILVNDEDLFLCRPLSTSLPITACDWEPFFDGDAPAIDLTAQLYAADVLPNGNLVFRSGADRTLPDLSAIKTRDLGLFIPDEPLKPYLGLGPYTSGTFKLYLDGDATQQSVGATPWDSLDVVTDGVCEEDVTLTGVHTCGTVGSLPGGSELGGVHFRDEDLIRCTPTANSSGGSITSCSYAMFLEADQVNGGNGWTGNTQAVELLGFESSSMSGAMLFRGPSDVDLPPHVAARDLLLYEGTFGNGICTGGKYCANDVDCPSGETCNTGVCDLGQPCATDPDCPGSGNDCNRTRTPVGTVSLYFDGEAAGLDGLSVQAVAILPDGDGDDVPDGVDNCPDVANPPDLCSDGLTPCATTAQCSIGDTCSVQQDSDGDGVGDPCDQCNGRDDSVCACGDGIRDVPSEQCDLGASNGLTGSPCSAICTVVGHCTGSATACVTAADCPSGEGCCGNTVVEGDETCDDGNVIDDDVCTNACALDPGGTPLLGCEDLVGPQIVPIFVKRAKFSDTADVVAPGFDKWKTKGDFNLVTGTAVDADSQLVRLVFNQGVAPTALYDKSLPAGTFVQSGSATTTRWKFSDREADVPGAEGLQKVTLKLKANKLTDTFGGRYAAIAVDPTLPVHVRQTVRIGDVCATGVLDCLPNASGKSLKCGTALFALP